MVDRIDQTDAVFRALADPTRREMVKRVSHGDCTVSELAEPFAMSLTGASKHIGILEEAGLLKRRKEGRERVCSFDPAGLFALRRWTEHYVKFWDYRLDALDRALKEDGNE